MIKAELTDGRILYFDLDDADYMPADPCTPSCIILRQAWWSDDRDVYERLGYEELDELHDDPHHAVIVEAYERHMWETLPPA
jgi:hypothetical protein